MDRYADENRSPLSEQCLLPEAIIEIVAEAAQKRRRIVAQGASTDAVKWRDLAVYLSATHAVRGGKPILYSLIGLSFDGMGGAEIMRVVAAVGQKRQDASGWTAQIIRYLEPKILARKEQSGLQGRSLQEILDGCAELKPNEILSFIAQYYNLDSAVMRSRNGAPVEKRARRIGHYLLAKLKVTSTAGYALSAVAAPLGIDDKQFKGNVEEVQNHCAEDREFEIELRHIASNLAAFSRLGVMEKAKILYGNVFTGPAAPADTAAKRENRPAETRPVPDIPRIVRVQKIDYAKEKLSDLLARDNARQDVISALIGKGFETVGDVVRAPALVSAAYAPKAVAEWLCGKNVPGYDLAIRRKLALGEVTAVSAPPQTVPEPEEPAAPDPVAEVKAPSSRLDISDEMRKGDIAAGMAALRALENADAPADDAAQSTRLDSYPFAQQWFSALLAGLAGRGIETVAAAQKALHAASMSSYAPLVPDFFDGLRAVTVTNNRSTIGPSPLARAMAKIAKVPLEAAYDAWLSPAGKWRWEHAREDGATSASGEKASQQSEKPCDSRDDSARVTFSILLRHHSIWNGVRSANQDDFRKSVTSALRRTHPEMLRNLSVFTALYRGDISPLVGVALRPEARYLINRLDLNRFGDLERIMPDLFPKRPPDAVASSSPPEPSAS